MKRVRRQLIIAAAVGGCALFWLWVTAHPVPPHSPAIPTPVPAAKVVGGDVATPPPKPAKLFHFNHEPTNPDEKALWDWWFYMDKHDPDFQWRTPISFYGRIIDQHSLPVVGATVKVVWSAIGKTPEQHLVTDAEGRFEISGVNGKGISVTVGAVGYTGGTTSNRSFEYSAFYEPHYHVPDKSKPVLFQLWKLEGAEPMYFWNKLKKMTVDGQKVWFDTQMGTFGASGDVAFSTKRGTSYAPRQFDWSLVIEAAPGGGIALRNEELMFEAPEGGYQQSWTHDIAGKGESYTISKTVKFYLKTADGKYAAMQADIGHMTIPEAEVSLSAYFNPSGSRNLQYDAKKRIGRK